MGKKPPSQCPVSVWQVQSSSVNEPSAPLLFNLISTNWLLEWEGLKAASLHSNFTVLLSGSERRIVHTVPS